MKSGLNPQKAVLPIVVTLWALTGANAGADVPLPYEQNGIIYMSGGVWQQGLSEMRRVAPKYPLELVLDFDSLVGKEGGMSVVGDVVLIRDSAGDVVLRTVTNGPLFLVRLPPGVYDVSITHRGRQHVRRAAIDPAQHERIVFGDGPGV